MIPGALNRQYAGACLVRRQSTDHHQTQLRVTAAYWRTGGCRPISALGAEAIVGGRVVRFIRQVPLAALPIPVPEHLRLSFCQKFTRCLQYQLQPQYPNLQPTTHTSPPCAPSPPSSSPSSPPPHLASRCPRPRTPPSVGPPHRLTPQLPMLFCMDTDTTTLTSTQHGRHRG